MAAHVAGFRDGSVAERLNLPTIRALPVCIPPLPEQDKIARTLGALDDKIELNRRMNETLESMARAIFKSWFVDFDPVRAKAEGRQPAGMDAETARLFPDSFTSTLEVDVPRSWLMAGLSTMVTVQREALDPGKYPDEVFDHFSIPAFDKGRTATPERGGVIKSIKFSLSRRVVLISKLNPQIPRAWLPNIRTTARALSSTEFIVTEPRTPFTREFVYCVFTSERFSESFAQLVTGTSGSHQRVKPDDFLKLTAVLPASSVVTRFTEVVEPILGRVMQNIEESLTLASVRDGLLPKLLSGELRVRDAEKLVEAHV
jgi:type I restriction enzyme S subunit